MSWNLVPHAQHGCLRSPPPPTTSSRVHRMAEFAFELCRIFVFHSISLSISPNFPPRKTQQVFFRCRSSAHSLSLRQPRTRAECAVMFGRRTEVMPIHHSLNECRVFVFFFWRNVLGTLACGWSHNSCLLRLVCVCLCAIEFTLLGNWRIIPWNHSGGSECIAKFSKGWATTARQKKRQPQISRVCFVRCALH